MLIQRRGFAKIRNKNATEAGEGFCSRSIRRNPFYPHRGVGRFGTDLGTGEAGFDFIKGPLRVMRLRGARITRHLYDVMSHHENLLNDVHSRLNPTLVRRVVCPTSVHELAEALAAAKQAGLRISVSGGRHAMGGQQFATDSVHIDMRGMCRVIGRDGNRGLLHIEAGAQWPAIIRATEEIPPGPHGPWGIRQKQTGVDEVTLGGSISANAHGRGLAMRPLGEDIENLTLMDADGALHFCDREKNARLFSLVVGGFGLFGIIVSATLRLSPRRYVRRVVDILDLEDAASAVFRRAAAGALYGDFQFVIDATDPRFLKRGVFACYMPAEEPVGEECRADLNSENWVRLLKLAHEDKRAAFAAYSAHYLSTDGSVYRADTMQLATYLPTYAEFVGHGAGSGAAEESLVIGELYVPRDRLVEFMNRAAEVLRVFGTEVIYGTIRSILRDRTAFLPWAREDFACVIFNLRTPHTPEGKARTADTFRALIDVAASLGGSFFLTYHKYATPEQVEVCHPRFTAWLEEKRRHDPDEFFLSDWYLHYRDAFAAQPGVVR
jgi:FAD/FMN-containing dehydrogenase